MHVHFRMNSASLSRFVVAACIVAASVASSAAADEITVDCPAYVDLMLRAQTKLARGNRNAALTEMEQAKAALERCLHEHTSGTGETALAAAEPAVAPPAPVRAALRREAAPTSGTLARVRGLGRDISLMERELPASGTKS